MRPRVYRSDVTTRLERPGDRRRPTTLDAWRLRDRWDRERERAPERREPDDLPF